jgi:hypothetical protein
MPPAVATDRLAVKNEGQWRHDRSIVAVACRRHRGTPLLFQVLFAEAVAAISSTALRVWTQSACDGCALDAQASYAVFQRSRCGRPQRHLRTCYSRRHRHGKRALDGTDAYLRFTLPSIRGPCTISACWRLPVRI